MTALFPPRAILAAAILFACAAPLHAQITRPSSAHRVVRAYDFEERETNPLPVPRGWYRAQHDPQVPRERPGFPLWNRAALDYKSPAFSGIGTVHLPTQGGSTSLVLRDGEINVFPEADYMISVRVRTKHLTHARARIVASFVDQRGNPLERSEQSSQLVRTDGAWTTLAVFLEGVEPDAASIRIEFQLLQPEQQPQRHRAASYTVWSQDYDAGAWFDDLIIAQVPMIGLATQSPINTVPISETPELDLRVRDLTGEDLSTTIQITDAKGHTVDQTTYHHGSASLNTSWTPELPGAGWYHAELSVRSGEDLVGRRDLDFAWSDTTEPERRSIFALGVTDPTERIIASVDDLAHASGTRTVELTASDIDTPADALSEGSAFTETIDDLVASGYDIGITLAEVPLPLADQAAIDPDALFEFINNRQELALEFLGPFFDRYGQVVSRWTIGATGNQDPATQLDPELRAVADALDPFVPGATIGLPWPVTRAFTPQLTRTGILTTVRDDQTLDESGFEDLVDLWDQARQSHTPTEDERPPISTKPPAPALALRLRPREDAINTATTPWDRTAWLARRAVTAWAAMRDPANRTSEQHAHRALVLEDPWTDEPGRRGRVLPAPELVAWRTLSTALGTRRPILEIDTIPGVRMFLCSPPEGSTALNDGAVVIWEESPSRNERTLNMPLSTEPVTALDLFGNRTEIPVTTKSELDLPSHAVRITRAPTIITRVNPELVAMLGSIRLAPDRLEAMPGTRPHTLEVHNPWDMAVRAKIYIVEPGGYADADTPIDRSWEIDPRIIDLTIKPKETASVPVQIAFSPGQIAGPIDFVFDAEISADRLYPLTRISRPVELDSSKVRLDIGVRLDHQTGYTSVTVFITNTSGNPIDASVSAIATAHPRQESAINALSPRAQSRRDFAFSRLTRGDRVVISVRASDGSIHLNEEIIIP